ncbi:MAG: hypothetical protein ACD_17C00375G0002 [uncultured bacterium]|nr:MAG: hypothetical protein ACD_17C00375G0002 [uncultured bacterium]
MESKKSLQALRQEIIAYLQKEFAKKKIKGTLVFDGAHRRDEESGLSYPNPLTVAYAPKGQSADEYIVERLELSKNRKIITVITNDRGLALHAKSLGAKVQANSSFICWLKKKKSSKTIKEPQDSPQNIDRLENIFKRRFEES